MAMLNIPAVMNHAVPSPLPRPAPHASTEMRPRAASVGPTSGFSRGGSRSHRPPSAASRVGPSSRRVSLLGGSERRLLDFNPFSHDPFDPFVDPTLTMKSCEKRGPSGQLCGN